MKQSFSQREILKLLIFFRQNLNFLNLSSNLLILQLENYLDKPVGASLTLALCYPLYGIGSGLGGSPRASLVDSPVDGSRNGLGDCLLSWLGSKLGSWLGS